MTLQVLENRLEEFGVVLDRSNGMRSKHGSIAREGLGFKRAVDIIVSTTTTSFICRTTKMF